MGVVSFLGLVLWARSYPVFWGFHQTAQHLWSCLWQFQIGVHHCVITFAVITSLHLHSVGPEL